MGTEKEVRDSKPFKILYFGDEAGQRALLGGWSEPEARILQATREPEVVTVAESERPQVIVVDLDQLASPSFEFLAPLVHRPGRCKVFGVVANKPLSWSVRAVKMGMEEVMHAEQDRERLHRELECELERWRAARAGHDLHARQRAEYDFSRILGRSEQMQRVLDVLARVIQRRWVTVLIRGETGTGKELIARAIHYNSCADFQPFVGVNCSALPETLLESELFGHERGAFTDARTQKTGLFEVAQDGTLFLDEIGEISPNIQVKLLKALEDKRIRRIGGTEEIQVQTRIIAATNRDLQAAIQAGTFRNDLYYRLNVIAIYLPPLRERGEDILLLARHFLARYVEEYESPIRGFTPEAEALLMAYTWPGNVRELKHTIERIVLLNMCEQVTRACLEEAIESETPLRLAEAKPTRRLQISIPPEGLRLDEGEKLIIAAVLEKTDWNKRRASEILGIARTRLDRKIKKYGLTSPSPE